MNTFGKLSSVRSRLRSRAWAAVKALELALADLEKTGFELSIASNHIDANAEESTLDEEEFASYRYLRLRDISYHSRGGILHVKDAVQLVQQTTSAVRPMIQGVHLAVVRARRALDLCANSRLLKSGAKKQTQTQTASAKLTLLTTVYLQPGVTLNESVRLGLKQARLQLQVVIAENPWLKTFVTDLVELFATRLSELETQLECSDGRIITLLQGTAGDAQWPDSTSRRPDMLVQVLLEEIEGAATCLATVLKVIGTIERILRRVSNYLVERIEYMKSTNPDEEGSCAKKLREKKIEKLEMPLHTLCRARESGERVTEAIVETKVWLSTYTVGIK